MCANYQRTSSAVEGRNGYLARHPIAEVSVSEATNLS
ncbi:MAG: hypothetical protein ACFCVD_14550 [Nodosilinea sp.]